ncbi:MAG: hypothetical protein LBJ31_05470 [Treponema sp.]|jgi:hypothetical protein|nr:hypothetical protein [Treponema sp.]
MKKIVICLVLVLSFASVITFAQSNGAQENKYVVTITYLETDGNIRTEKIDVLATSSTEAENKATRQWDALKQTGWEFKFANAERIDEPAQSQAVTPQTIGYLKITNSHPWPTNLNQTKMWVDGISIKPSSSSAYESYSSSRLGTDKSTSIALPTGIYDVKVEVFRNWFDMRTGDVTDTIYIESRNVAIREDMVTEVSMRGGNLSVSQPRRE